MCRSRLWPSRLCAGLLICRAAYALSRVCTEPAYVLSRFAAVLAVRDAYVWGRYMLGRL
jgi:hypothetical protein